MIETWGGKAKETLDVSDRRDEAEEDEVRIDVMCLETGLPMKWPSHEARKDVYYTNHNDHLDGRCCEIECGTY